MRICPHCGHDLRADEPVRVGGFSYDPLGPAYWLDTAIDLTPSLRIIMSALVRSPDRIISRAVLCDRLDVDITSRQDIVHMKRLRQRLRAAGVPEAIRTHYGLGYSLCSAQLRAPALLAA